MTNAEWIIDYIRRVADLLEDGKLAEVMLQAARSDHLNFSGDMYGLWCDDQGGCSESEECNDEMHLACIQRFLNREFS